MGAVITCLSSTMAKRWPTLFLGDVAELARAHAVEAEIHDRLAGLLVEALAGVGQAVARHHHPALHHDLAAAGAFLSLVQHAAGFRRRSARRVALGSACLVHQLEGHLGGLAQHGLELGGILQARHLHQDAVLARARDGRARGCPSRRCAGAPLRWTGPSPAGGSGSCRPSVMRRVKRPPPGSVTSYSLAPTDSTELGHGGIEALQQGLRASSRRAGSVTRT